MKKIILSFLFSLFYFQLYASIPVEDIFVDIDKNYKYYRELQELSDRGIIFPDEQGKLNPLKLLNRDEFVGISTEVTCKKCIQPDVDLEYIERYMGNQKYFDVDENNKYYYCISEADTLEQVKGYDEGQKCENGTFKEGERAFCPLNVITKEEAYAVILRNSKLWTIEQNKDLIDRIYAGESFEKLSDDVGPKNIDGSPYTFYGYLNKALEFQLLEYDVKGNAIVTPLLELVDNKIYPKKALTKEEFIVMAYIALRSNNCLEVEKKDEIAINLHIKDASCSEGKNNCKNLTLDSNISMYDFEPEVISSCATGVKSYVWRFYNTTTGEKIIKYENYVDNFIFPSFGQWNVYLRAIDNCGGTSEVHSTIFYTSNSLIKGKIDIYGKECALGILQSCTKLGSQGKTGENTYDFNGELEGGNIFKWIFTNRDTGDIIRKTGKYVNDVVFPKDGIWDIELEITDIDGKNTKVQSYIEVDTGVNESSVLIEILDSTCVKGVTCTKPPIAPGTPIPEGPIDIKPILLPLTCNAGIKSYNWELYHAESEYRTTKSTEYIDNYTFPKLGEWEITLTIEDNCGNTTEVSRHVVVGEPVIDILEGTCIEGTPCTKPPIAPGTPIPEGPIDIKPTIPPSTCNAGIKSYNWELYHAASGYRETKSTEYIDNYTFPKLGEWEITLTIEDNCGNTTEVSRHVVVGEPVIEILDPTCVKGVTCTKPPITPGTPIPEGPIDIKPTIPPSTCNAGIKSYNWELYHAESGYRTTKSTEYIDNYTFPKLGEWEITLTIEDKCGKTIEVSRQVVVGEPVIEILDSTCIEGTPCTEPPIAPGIPIPEGSIDIKPTIPPSTCNAGIKSYNWELYHAESGYRTTKSTEYIDNYTFPKLGDWEITLSIEDKCGKTIEVSRQVVVGEPGSLTGLSVSIDANPISGSGPLEVDFKSIVFIGSEIKEYTWNFGDGETSNGKNTTHVYDEKGTYEVELRIEDIHGNYFTATVNIYVDIVDCSIDIDNDGISDCEDKCIGVKGEKLNLGCPILEKQCDSNGLCPRGYTCSTSDSKLYLTEGICTIDTSSIGTTGASGDTPGKESISKNCLYDTSKDTIYGNVVCNSCPCNLSIDYNASIRKCDVLFPAITSPDSTEIYSKGKMFLVK